MLRSGKNYLTDSFSEKDSFEIWKQNVDNLVFAKLNMHCLDLPDEDYWMNWHNDLSSQQMTDIVVKNTLNMFNHFNNVAKI